MKDKGLVPLSVLLGIFLAIPGFSARAEFAQFTESFTERMFRRPGEVPTAYAPVGIDRTAFHAQYTLEGLGSLPIDASTVLALQVGSFTFQATVGEADVALSNKWVFYLTTSWVEPTRRTRTIRTGEILFARKGNLLTVLAWDGHIGNAVLTPPYVGMQPGTGAEPPTAIRFGTPQVGQTIVADQYWDVGHEHFSGEIPLSISVGGLTLNRTLYYQGSADPRRSSRGNISLSTILAHGTSDRTPPRVWIVTPKAGATQSDTLTVGVRALDNREIAGTFVSVNNRDKAGFEAATLNPGTGLWEVQETLNPGVNFIRAYAVDGSSNASPVALVRVTR